MSVTINDDDYRRRLEEAVEARDDGEPEESATRLEALLLDFPGDPAVALEYARTMTRLTKAAEADAALEAAMEMHPGYFELHAMWADLPLFDCDWTELARRGDVLRGLFPPELSSYHLIHELLALRESFRWDDAADLVRTFWKEFTTTARIFPHAIDALSTAVRIDDLEALLDAAAPEIWRDMPLEAQGNVRLRIETMRRNRALIEETGVRLISIGQNCLPFQLPRRWGLNTSPFTLENLVPFDQGGFPGNRVAEAIEGNFAGYGDRAAYGPAYNHWTRGYTLHHHPTAVAFYHWRGPYWLDNDRERFFAHWEQMVANWNRLHRQGKRLFVFSLVGAGDLNQLIEVAKAHFLDDNSHLLIVDVQKEARGCAPQDRVTYLHDPYPDDYDWISVNAQNTARGIRFETRIADAIAVLVKRLAADAAPGVSATTMTISGRNFRRMFDAAAKAIARGDNKACAAILDSMQSWLPDDPETALADARALLTADRFAEADQRLTTALLRFPDDFPLRKFWAERALAVEVDWNEAVRRIRGIRATLPADSAPAMQCLISELSWLYNGHRWQEVYTVIRENWSACLTDQGLFLHALDLLGKLFQVHQAGELVAQATPQAKARLPSKMLQLIVTRIEAAKMNAALLEYSEFRVVSLGRTGLPFIVAGKWGLQTGPADPDALTPFDLGEFSLNATVNAIATDFAGFLDRAKFGGFPSGNGSWMMRHEETGVGFFAERGRYWLKDGAALFFDRLKRLVANWQTINSQDNRLFVFCHNDDGNLDHLVEAAETHLLGRHAHLLILDLHPAPHPWSARRNVSYRHLPKPPEYLWTNPEHGNSGAGFTFEQSLTSTVSELLGRLAAEQNERHGRIVRAS